MKRLHPTSWLLIAVMLTLFSGAASFVHVHEHVHHDEEIAAGHEHCSHGPVKPSSESPDAPQPADHDDCGTCFVLLHLSGSTLDFESTVQDAPLVRDQAPLMPAIVFAVDTTPVPPMRGPPLLIQL